MSAPHNHITTEALRLLALGQGDDRIARTLKLTRHAVRMIAAANKIMPVQPRNAVAFYESACHALAQARTLIEVKDVADRSMALAEYGRLAKDRSLQIDATELRIRAVAKLGQFLIEAPKNTGARGIGKSAVPNANRTPTLEEIGIDKKLSSEAQKLASISSRALESRIATWRTQAEHGAGRVTANLMRDGDKREQREQRERDLATKINAGNLSLPTKKYGVILADPAWRFEPQSRVTGMDRAADNHYPTTPTDKIAALDVASIAAKAAVLFLWATGPMIREALMVMDAWGFEYKSQMIWGKPQIGSGYWFREQHELLLVGTRGSPVAPAMGTQPGSLLMADRTKHSAKPVEVYQIIERWYPNVPKIELNARTARSNWDAWGLDAPEQVDPETGEIAAWSLPQEEAAE